MAMLVLVVAATPFGYPIGGREGGQAGPACGRNNAKQRAGGRALLSGGRALAACMRGCMYSRNGRIYEASFAFRRPTYGNGIFQPSHSA